MLKRAVTEHVNGVQVRAIDDGEGKGHHRHHNTACVQALELRTAEAEARAADAEAALGHEELARMQQQQQQAASSSAAAAAAEAPGGVELADMHVRGTRRREGGDLYPP